MSAPPYGPLIFLISQGHNLSLPYQASVFNFPLPFRGCCWHHEIFIASPGRSLPPWAAGGFSPLRPQSCQIPSALPGRFSHIFLLHHFHFSHTIQMLPSLRPSHVASRSIPPPVGPYLFPGGYPAYSGRVLPDTFVRIADRSECSRRCNSCIQVSCRLDL